MTMLINKWKMQFGKAGAKRALAEPSGPRRNSAWGS